MKIQITQGHEKGIGIEVFLKACLMMSEKDLACLEFNAYKDSVVQSLKYLKLPFEIDFRSITLCDRTLSVDWLLKKNQSQSFNSLITSIEKVKKGDVLYTLPTSKDQFPGFPGHTEFFRSHFKKPDLGMYFSSPDLKVLLLSDHLPLKDVVQLSQDVIYHRLKTSLHSLMEMGHSPSRILVSGFNPHAGEGGLIGIEDERITHAIKRLRSDFKIDMSGPIPGDTMILNKESPNDLLVYVFHDQGLGVFKSIQGFIGSNITLGLPFFRFSPDHGTSFGLYGNNIADYRGCAYSLSEAITVLKRFSHGKNTSHKSKGS